MSDYQDWIGRETTRSEPISERMLEEYRATLAGTLAPGAVPPGFHWCLGPDICTPDLLGRDGHPRTGIFLPALPLPRRMWAGGTLAFHAPFQRGEMVTRHSRIENVTFKTGRSGKLGFVTVSHRYTVDNDPRIDETQDIVYREEPGPGPAPTPPQAPDWPDATGWDVSPDPTLLFRYSAMTFNGHRIHYDHPYATGVEGYGGLVVHGPMQAVWMQNLCAQMIGHLPRQFRYRGLSPLICGTPVRVEAKPGEDGTLELRVRATADNRVTMHATATTEG